MSLLWKSANITGITLFWVCQRLAIHLKLYYQVERFYSATHQYLSLPTLWLDCWTFIEQFSCGKFNWKTSYVAPCIDVLYGFKQSKSNSNCIWHVEMFGRSERKAANKKYPKKFQVIDWTVRSWVACKFPLALHTLSDKTKSTLSSAIGKRLSNMRWQKFFYYRTSK